MVKTDFKYLDNENEKFYENFNIIQPGFKDTRDIPKIELNTHTKIEELTSYNSIKNGIQSLISISHQTSWNTKNKKNNTIIHQAPANPSLQKSLSSILLPPAVIIL